MAKDGIKMKAIPAPDELQKRLKEFQKKASNTSAPAKQSAVWMLRSINDRFKKQGPNDLGVQWAPLKPETLRRRVQGTGTGTPQILFDTGRMRQSVSANPIKDGIAIQPGVFYADFHHPPDLSGHGITTGDMPNRAFMYLDEKDNRIIDGFYQKDLDKQVDRLIQQLARKGVGFGGGLI